MNCIQIEIVFASPDNLALARPPRFQGGVFPGHLWVAAKAITTLESQRFTKSPLPESKQPTLIIEFEGSFPQIFVYGHFTSTMLFAASEWLKAHAKFVSFHFMQDVGARTSA